MDSGDYCVQRVMFVFISVALNYCTGCSKLYFFFHRYFITFYHTFNYKEWEWEMRNK